jgi:hypothetical protein
MVLQIYVLSRHFLLYTDADYKEYIIVSSLIRAA